MSKDALQALRMQGAHLHDPVRFRYLEALAERMQAQPASVRQVLTHKLGEAVADYRLRVDRAQEAAPSKAKPVAIDIAARSPSRSRSLLAQLNHDIAERTRHPAPDALSHDMAGEPGSPSDMKSVRRFAEVWSKIATEQQLSQALTRGPELAGPLNSHNLMLRAMSLMHGLSPDYLRRFLSQADALLWLEHMNQHNALAKDGKPARRARAKK